MCKSFLIFLTFITGFPLGGSFLLAQAPSSLPISHFIFIIQENHSFDNYFGTYPGANGIPPGTMLAAYPGGPLAESPFLLNGTEIPNDLQHSFLAAAVAHDGGAMDGFLWAAYPAGDTYYGRGIPVPTPNPNLVKIVPITSPTPPPAPSPNTKRSAQARRSSGRKSASSEMIERLSLNGFADDEDAEYSAIGTQDLETPIKATAAFPKASKTPPTAPSWANYAISYVDGATIPNYWTYAANFTLLDNFFSALRGPSAPNHLYAVAASSGGLVNNNSLLVYGGNGQRSIRSPA